MDCFVGCENLGIQLSAVLKPRTNVNGVILSGHTRAVTFKEPFGCSLIPVRPRAFTAPVRVFPIRRACVEETQQNPLSHRIYQNLTVIACAGSDSRNTEGEAPDEKSDDSNDDECGKSSNSGHEPEGVSENTTADWDTSWNELSKSRSGGVFSFPSEGSESDVTNPNVDLIDKRTERLTSLWTNENGYLFGIVGLFGILAFYAYVFQTGGIRH